MRGLLLSLALSLTLALTASTTTSPKPVDFEKQIQPILEAKCQPCHFPGGKMYAKRPFDKPATIVDLGEKLFTRIKDEDQRKVIRAFLAEQAHSAHR
ncbi:MAG TPA: hypothetical protein VHX14_00330 [Thermoanaerobaculia bacterium]|jgi:hypothetical protein|nr:hypothetical protein [Thermoanaerobaculia bacterium]